MNFEEIDIVGWSQAALAILGFLIMRLSPLIYRKARNSAEDFGILKGIGVIIAVTGAYILMGVAYVMVGPTALESFLNWQGDGYYYLLYTIVLTMWTSKWLWRSIGDSLYKKYGDKTAKESFMQGWNNQGNAVTASKARRASSTSSSGLVKEPKRKTKPKPENKKAFSFAKEARQPDDVSEKTEVSLAKSSQTVFGTGHQLCATCEMWGGDREVKPSRKHVIAASSDRGECRGGGHNRHQVPATGRCAQYQKMGVLS
jgi:hypothetical protein